MDRNWKAFELTIGYYALGSTTFGHLVACSDAFLII